MNSDAPEHRPPLARDVALIRWASQKMFIESVPVSLNRINIRFAELEQINAKRQKITQQNLVNERLPSSSRNIQSLPSIRRFKYSYTLLLECLHWVGHRG